ncbi:CoA transferase [Oceanithermus sp.]|uniref:CaiB/BaiF CoA transferase family protein n=1 Tax=Oceanithermus sp. TaxID=2268145 RepID=UPI0025DB3FCC|nr:CoA transferase [Oceanithermus sp.]
MGALDGLIVLDLSRILAGPYATQMLADLGAEVWKVESPWGDDTRRWGPPFQEGESAYFLSTNRGKKSLAVNLKDPRGQRIVRRLAERADVLVENFKAGDLARYGLDYPSLAEVNPRLVYASITGFGQTGPRAAEPGYDAALQGMTGIMSVTGDPDGPPMKVGVAWIDVLTGLTAAVGILAALREREISGRGQHLDLALFDVGVAAMVNQAQAYLMTGLAPKRMGNAHPQIVPYQAFEASDKWFILAVGNDTQYRRLVEAIGRPDLWEDARYRTNAGRVEHRSELVAELAQVFKTRSRAEWLELLRGAGVPVTPVNDVGEALADPQAEARGLLWEVAHPKLGSTPLLASPLQHMDRTPARPAGPPPLLGQHTREVLTGALGMDEEEVRALAEEGVLVLGGEG